MKTINTIVLSTVMAMCSANTVLAQDQHETANMNHEMMGMIADPGQRSMMMDQIAGNPEMRAKMQKHLDMMQAMLDTDGADQAKMQEMMSNPEMKSMMEKHMLCGQMMHAGTTGEQATHDHSN